MEQEISGGKMIILFLFGIVGCILLGASDWMMIYGDILFTGNLSWLTLGVAKIPQWRNSLALILAFPAIIFYSIALFGFVYFLPKKSYRKIYTMITAISMTPWLCLHLFYVMIFHIFAWVSTYNTMEYALILCEEIFHHFSWMIPISEVFMIMPFLYLFYLIISNKSILKRFMAWNNPLIIYFILKGITMFMPNVPFRLAFTNGLMSESMLIYFIIYVLYISKFMIKQNIRN